MHRDLFSLGDLFVQFESVPTFSDKKHIITPNVYECLLAEDKMLYEPIISGLLDYRFLKTPSDYPDLRELLGAMARVNQAIVVAKKNENAEFEFLFINQPFIPSYNSQSSGLLFPITAVHNKEVELNFSTTVLKAISENIKLLFDKNPTAGNLCYAFNNEDLRDEYKISFTAVDLLDYLYGALHNKSLHLFEPQEHASNIKIRLPKDNEQFWNIVRYGRKLKEIHSFTSMLLARQPDLLEKNIKSRYLIRDLVLKNTGIYYPDGEMLFDISNAALTYSWLGVPVIKHYLQINADFKLEENTLKNLFKTINACEHSIGILQAIENLKTQ
ncbi:MAG TPA: hypothetical protein H9853_09030 [Candidatus Sphingobacterium stercoripullorum]|uniref:Type ISP restriction-modification enzyme LLaBIII C-terminal specificity domain-containing protein n=1 Tax=Candidatus Sphingobacterium stercoripullorum TaxID=2838759 RepID=A0A9D1W9Y4_9SPHI|nr:hypothetical protein [Candidatus Sphingobacterium stercoripullorum]